MNLHRKRGHETERRKTTRRVAPPSLLFQPRKVAVVCLIFLLFWLMFWTIRTHGATGYGSFTLYAEDTLIDQELPDTQSWSATSPLQLGNSTVLGHEHRGYFKFNLSSAYRGSLTITLASLMIYMSNIDIGSAGAEVDIYNTNNETWFDHNVTWNSAPPIQQIEVYDSVHSDMAKWYNFYISDAGNSTFGVGGLQDAYDNNTTRTYVMAFFDFYALMSWESDESTSYRPNLVVQYEQTTSSESTSPRPNILHPTSYNLKFFADEDAVIESWNVTNNRGTENESQVEALVSAGYITIMYLKFNLSFPDRVDGLANSDNFTLTSVNWYAEKLDFKIYCSLAPQTVDFRGYYVTEGIRRVNESSWNETSLTWTNAPETRGYTSLVYWIDSTGYKTLDLLTEEDYIRYSVQNETTYTVVFEVDQRSSRNVFSNFATSEADSSLPYIEMNVVTEPYAFSIQGGLTFTTADDYLASSWNLSAFIAGHLLSAMIYLVTVVPIAWIGRKGKASSLMILILIISALELSAFVWFTWLNTGIFVILLILLILFAGGVLKG